MARSLLLNADDFGRDPATDRAILGAHRAGVVRSASAFVTTPYARAALRELRSTAPRLGVGLHVDLSDGAPIARESIPALGRSGAFLSPVSCLLSTSGAPAFEAEITAQIERFEEAYGRMPDHLDGHHHLVFLHPAAFEALVACACRFDLPVRSPLDFADELRFDPLARRLTARHPELEPLVRATPSRVAAILARFPRLRHPRAVALRFFGADATLETVASIVDGLPDGVTELACHPGASDAELALLVSPALRRVVGEVDLVGYEAVS